MTVIDVHTHGIGGYGTAGASAEDILAMARIHGALGVDAIVPTIYSASIEAMRKDIAAVDKAMQLQTERDEDRAAGDTDGTVKDGEAGERGAARILGVHLEGPFLNPSRAGALDGDAFLLPRFSSWERLAEGFQGIIRIMTIAPELDGAGRLIRVITDSGVIVNMGHSDATYDEAEAAYNAGARGVTHIFNAMRPMHHREPGLAGFGLVHPHIYVEFIGDPHHLHPKTIELIVSAKNKDRIIVVSDSVKATHTDEGSGPDGVTDRSARLTGGSMALSEAVRYLGDLGLTPAVLDRFVGVNPTAYLGI